MIHFLQQIMPPILPVLQEPVNCTNKPLIGVNGWNVWFNDDISTFSNMPSQNVTNLTPLFKAFFLYYGNFNFNFNVVSIRKLDLISKFQKNWHNCMMAIEGMFVSVVVGKCNFNQKYLLTSLFIPRYQPRPI